jgi:predicted ATPase
MVHVMQIESLEIKNYRLFKDVRLSNLSRMTVVVGANGSGKSTLFDVFSFLKEALTQNVATAVTRRGGFNELVSRGTKGPIGITVKFRESGGRLATYALQVGLDDRGRATVDREILSLRRGQYGKPWHFVDFSHGCGTAITNESAYGQEGVTEQRAEHVLDDPSALAIKGLVPRARNFVPICCHAAKGLPVLVHLNGFAIVRLK